ncbi:MAG TPA: glycosyltransferase family 2 protein [Solirubrobacteraceae bacterium]|nr:glycosyltransferase family 2 protein [Solirubrobacteraceae bacterium]
MPAPVAIAVVSWNTRDLLRSCLASLHADVESGRASVTVVDNASNDGSAELVRAEFPWAELIVSEANLGFGAAVNLAAKRSETEWLAVANADVELTAGALEHLLAAGAAHPRAAIIAPRLIGPDGETQHSVHPFPTLPLTLAFNLGLATLAADRLTLEGGWDPERPRTVDWALGAFLLVRRDAFQQIGGFDERQWMYAEDLDLGWRATRAGWQTWFEPTARVRHVGAAATAQAWGEARRERWVHSTYGWMLRRRGLARTRAYALMNAAGALARMGLLRGARRAEMREWFRLHREALLSSRDRLAGHN